MFNCSNYLIICSGEVVKPWHFTFSLGICICNICNLLDISISVFVKYRVKWFSKSSLLVTLSLSSVIPFTGPLGHLFFLLSSIMFVRGFLFKMNLLTFQFAGETERLKRIYWVRFLKANSIKLESCFTVGSFERQVRNMASSSREFILYIDC